MKKQQTPAFAWLETKGYPTVDDRPPTISEASFSTGGHYGVEVPVINSMACLEATLEAIRAAKIRVTRFNETVGAFLLSDGEILEMLAACREANIGITMSLGPRPEYDVRASFYRSEFGLEQGRRLNNNDAIRVCCDEAIRLAELGARGLIAYDLGVITVLAEMRADGLLPADLTIKASSHCMVTNQYIARVHAQAGADSVTTVHDLSAVMLGDIRAINPGLCLDVPTDAYKSKGGYIRFHELAGILVAAAPVILKMGASAQGHPYDSIGNTTYAKRIDRVARGLEVLDQTLSGHEMVGAEDPIAAIPALPGSYR
jgi:hypothetical protein